MQSTRVTDVAAECQRGELRRLATVQIRTGGSYRPTVKCRMSIERDNAVERQVRVDRMIEEFRDAQARRLARLNDKVVEPKADAHPTASPAGSAQAQ